MKPKLFSVWEGVYNSFSEAGGDLDAFDTDIWINKQKDRIYTALQSHKTNSFTAKDYPLPLVVAMALSQKESLKILDFGGGMGLQYLEVIAKIPNSENKIDYYIIDGKSSIDNLPSEINQFSRLNFFYDFHEIDCEFDIIHIGSTLQYIENWQNLLQTLMNKFNPTYFVFSDLLAGNVTTFVSHQIFYDKRIPHIFLNFEEFSKFIQKNLGLKILFQTKFIHSILDQEKVFPNNALPKKFRIDRAYNLVCSSI